MKTIQLSFLFLYCILLALPNLSEAQKVYDSEDYYNAIYTLHKSETPIDSAIVFFQNKLNSLPTHQLSINHIYYHRVLGDALSKQGKYFESENSFTKVLQIINSINKDSLSKKEIAYILNIQNGVKPQLGTLYRKIHSDTDALLYYEDTLKILQRAQDSAAIMNNIALIYMDQEKYAKAESFLVKAYNKVQHIKGYNHKRTILNNLGFVQSKQDNSEGLEKMMLALKGNLDNGSTTQIFSSYRHLSIHYKDNNQDSLALLYAVKAQDIGKNLNPHFVLGALELKMGLHEDSEIRFYQNLKDSIHKSQLTNDNKYVAKKYDYEKEKNEKIETQLKLTESENKNIIIIFGTITIIIISFFSLLYYRQYSRQEKDRERHRTERVLSKKVHDEVGNDLFYLMAQIQSSPHEFLEKNGLKLLDGLNDIYGKARDISKHYTAVHTGSNYNEELLNLLNSYGSEQVKIITNKIESNFWEVIDASKKEAVYRVLQELLTNMKKHSNANFVAITFSKDPQKMHIKYVDNGIGVNLNNLTHKNGLSNVESRMATLKGSITFESAPNQGFKAFVKLSI